MMTLKGKKLLVMGGVSQHKEIVEYAMRMGLYVIVVDYLKDSPCKKIADENHLISITDIDAIVKLCREKKVDGVMNGCIDPGQKPYQIICEQLGLPCYGTKEQFNIMTNKDFFYETCIKYGLDVIPRYDINNVEFPLVVKPVDGRASKGISVCRQEDQLEPAIKKALSYSTRQKIIFEKYMKRNELCAKYFVSNGDIFLSSLSDTYSYFKNGEKVYMNGKFFPSKYIDLYKETDHKVRNMIKHLGIKNGPLSFTAFFDEGKFRFFDPSFRLGGGQQWRIEAAATGIDQSYCMTNFAITGVMGDSKEISKIESGFDNQYAASVYFLLDLGQ